MNPQNSSIPLSVLAIVSILSFEHIKKIDIQSVWRRARDGQPGFDSRQGQQNVYTPQCRDQRWVRSASYSAGTVGALSQQMSRMAELHLLSPIHLHDSVLN